MNKRGDSNKACSWEFFLKKNKKNSMLIRDFRVPMKVEKEMTLKWAGFYNMRMFNMRIFAPKSILFLWRVTK